MYSKTAFLALSLSTAVLSGCTSMNIFKDNETQPPPEQSLDSASPTGLSADDIRQTLSGKSWNWRGPSNSGVTLFAEDGTSLIEVTGKGTTKGKWFAKDGELCESVDPAPFIPNGAPMSCRPFSGSGSNYRVGNAEFTLSS